MRFLMLSYAVLCYGAGFLAVLYAIGFTGNLLVPKAVDTGPYGSTGTAVLVDLGLIALFGLQHSVMARPAFKDWWTRFVPAPVERATYLLATSLALGLLFWLWRPIPGGLWEVTGTALAWPLWALFALGWALVVLSGFLIDHFHLFGMKQALAPITGREPPAPGFQTPSLYRRVRHPIYFGLLLGFWATPAMTWSHLLLAAGVTVYILIGAVLEEHDLEAHFGDVYRDYQQRVPMLLPRLAPRGPRGQGATSAEPGAGEGR